MERTRDWDDVPPIKNVLHTLVKVIRQHQQPRARVFVANMLPAVLGSLLSTSVQDFNMILIAAIHSTARAMGKTFVLSLYEHMVSKKGKVIRPMNHYFMPNEQLTYYGCLIVRDLILREAGVKAYWFRDKDAERYRARLHDRTSKKT